MELSVGKKDSYLYVLGEHIRESNDGYVQAAFDWNGVRWVKFCLAAQEI